MGRPRSFDAAAVRAQAATLFARQGYHATSVDDLVAATGLLRGSLYQAFGSKLNLFIAVLEELAVHYTGSPTDLDLLTVALKDFAASDPRVRRLCQSIATQAGGNIAGALGTNLLAALKEN